ncbi:MAG TPA: hypothetical protein PLY23_03790 [Alphaproteobacteria bacterium]|nr:hypothetical protein [Alphaproteobacteria bacterium]
MREKFARPSLASLISSDLPVKVHCFLALQFSKQDPTYEHRLLVAPFLKKIQHDHNLEKFRGFLKAQGIILREELDDRTFTKQGRIGKNDVMLVSRDGKRFFWCNGKTSCIELRSVETPENILRVFPIKLETDYKFIDLTHFGDTHLVVEVGKKGGEKNSYKEAKILIFDIETGNVKSLVDKEFPYAEFFYPYKKTPQKIWPCSRIGPPIEKTT